MSAVPKTTIEKKREEIFEDLRKHEIAIEHCKGAIAILNMLLALPEAPKPEPEKPSA